MQRSHRTYSAHTTHTDRSQEVSEKEQWFEVGVKSKKSNEPYPLMPTQDSRVLIEELVMVSDLMPQLMSQEVISRDAYFGKYGPIAKTILTVKNDPDTKISFNQAFITYTNSLDSSLAIAALMDFSHKKYKTSVSYGTCKFCAAFIKGIPCKIPDCYFIHEAKWETISIKSLLKMTKRDKLKPVFQKINENLQYFIKKEHKEFLDSKLIKLNQSVFCTCSKIAIRQKIQFPSIKDTLKLLGEKGFINWNKYQQIKLQYKLHIHSKRKVDVQLRQPKLQLLQLQENSVLEKEDKQKVRIQDAKEGKEVGDIKEEVRVVKKMHQEYPQILKEYLTSGPFEKLKIAHFRESRNLQFVNNAEQQENQLTKYLNVIGSAGLNTYIHHKLVRQANKTNQTQSSLFDFARKPRTSYLVKPEHLSYNKIVLSTLTDI